MSGRSFLATVVTMGLMSIFGYGVWAVLGTMQTKTNKVSDPTQVQALVDMPGTIFVAQQGSLYSLHGLQFTKLNTPPGDWVQVAPAPGGDLLAVNKGNGFSDVYLLSPQGQVLRTLLTGSATGYFQNHFYFYPRVSANGQTLFYSWNWIDPTENYNVDFELKSSPFSNPASNSTNWSLPLYFQGGDVEPLPLSNGGLLYAKYFDPTGGNGQPYSQLAYVTTPGATPQYLTTPAQNCSEPAINPRGTAIAMICTNNQEQSTTLQEATWNGTSMGAPRVICTGRMPAMPVWSPDGNSVLYMNVPVAGEPFQLYWIPKAAAAKPGAPQQVTQSLSLTATSNLVWYS